MRYLVAVPIYNEEKTVLDVLHQIRRYAPDILVIDDGSTDRTPELLDGVRGIQILRHHHNLGYGQTMIDAFDYAHRHGYDWIITMDCDEQHEPSQIPEFVREALRDDADIISGSRYMESMLGNSLPPLDRRAINQQITDLLNEVLHLGITDSFCGYKAFRLAAIRRLHLNVPGYGMPLQFWVQAFRHGLRIREIPVRLIYNDPNRQFGGSLDDPNVRLLHYYEVLIHALADSIKQPVPCPNPAASGR